MTDTTQIKMTAQEFMTLPESSEPIELIEGEIIVSPTPRNPHQTSVLSIAVYLRTRFSLGTTIIAPMDVHLDDENVVQPDVFWVSGGDSHCKLGVDSYWYGASDLAIEVLSPSTELRDRKVKYALYEKHQTREYWLVDPEVKSFEVYQLNDGEFARIGVFGAGETFHSVVLNALINIDDLL